MSDVQTRRNFLNSLFSIVVTPLLTQDAVNELESKVRALISNKKFDDAIALAQSERNYEKLEAECHKEYAEHLKKIVLAGGPASKLKEFEELADKAISEYTFAFKDATLNDLPDYHAERASLLVARKRYDEAIADYSYVIIKAPKLASGYGGIVDVKLRKGESDSISDVFLNLSTKNPNTLDAAALIKGSTAGVQFWFSQAKKQGGTIQHGLETIAFFTRTSELFLRSWMNKGKNGTLDERFSAGHREEALYCTYLAGAATYASQPFELALTEYDLLVKPRYERMKEHVEGNLLESDKFVQRYLAKIEFKNKKTLFEQLARRAKK